MNLKHLTDHTLLIATKSLVREEREILTALLHHLREIERRRLYSTVKCQSLFAYLMSELGYPEDQANRRIQAMRLMRDLPEIEGKIASGALSLTNMVLAQTLFAKEKKSGRILGAEQKIEILGQLEHQSVRSAQKIVGTINPEMKRKENRLDFDSIEDEALREKLLREKCQNCGSGHAIEIDHIVPEAVGGPSTLENLRLLCRSCNQRAAIQYFGLGKMGRYLRSPSSSYVCHSPPSRAEYRDEGLMLFETG